MLPSTLLLSTSVALIPSVEGGFRPIFSLVASSADAVSSFAQQQLVDTTLAEQRRDARRLRQSWDARLAKQTIGREEGSPESTRGESQTPWYLLAAPEEVTAATTEAVSPLRATTRTRVARPSPSPDHTQGSRVGSAFGTAAAVTAAAVMQLAEMSAIAALTNQPPAHGDRHSGATTRIQADEGGQRRQLRSAGEEVEGIRAARSTVKATRWAQSGRRQHRAQLDPHVAARFSAFNAHASPREAAHASHRATHACAIDGAAASPPPAVGTAAVFAAAIVMQAAEVTAVACIRAADAAKQRSNDDDARGLPAA